MTLKLAADFALFSLSSSLIVWLAVVHRRTLLKLEAQNEERSLLVKEIEHRGSNILAVVDMIVKQTFEDKDKATDAINRVRAVVSTQDILDASEAGTATLRAMLTQELLDTYGDNRIALNGEPVELSGPVARALRLVFHEMATNALKHGALSQMSGKVSIDWKVEGDNVIINWCELGGPKAAVPAKYNFGSKLITRTLKALGAEFEPTFAETGYCYRIDLPLRGRSAQRIDSFQ